MSKEEKVEVNTLKTFGSVFQIKCISALLSDRGFMERIVDILSSEYFEADAHKWIVDTTVAYFIQYKELPTKEVFKLKLKQFEENQGVLKEAIVQEITKAEKHLKDTDSVFIKEQFLTYCKQMKLKQAIMKSVDYLKSGDYEAIKHEVDAAMRAGMERNLGHDYLNDIDSRMSSMARTCIKTKWDLIDGHLDGGLGNGELGFIVAPAGSGKSWLLARLGAEAMKQQKNILHVTLELNENYVGLRYDSYMTGIAFQKVRENIDVVKKKLDELKANGLGRCFVKFWPLKTISPQNIKMHVDRIQMVHQVKIDMLIVDYADILRPFMTDRNSNSYSEAGSVYEELRQVAGELQIPVWSASQSNRGSHHEEVIQAHGVADSYRKIMTGDFIISLSRKTEDKLANTGRIHIIKNRFGPDGETFALDFDTSNGKALIYDKESPEGRAILAKAKDTEQTVEDLLRGAWNDHKGKGGAGTDQD